MFFQKLIEAGSTGNTLKDLIIFITWVVFAWFIFPLAIGGVIVFFLAGFFGLK